jgi:dolichol-phosphate mannosyltransferase
LKAAITFGVILASISAISMVLLFYKSLKYGFAVTGWASLIATIIFSTGSLMTILGILGVYLGRVFNEVKSRPLYIVDEITNITR